MNTIECSIIICTHDRADDVGANLKSLATQLSDPSFEAFLVDSNSSETTNLSLQRLAKQFSFIELIRIEVAGLSKARNAGVDASKGEWVAFLDDDAIPYPNWVHGLRSTILTCPSDVAIIAGKVIPLWPEHEEEPSHIDHIWRQFLSLVEENGIALRPRKFLFAGANLVIRKSALLDIGKFPEDLGRVGDNLAGGEDSFIVGRLREKGYGWMYSDVFPVKHKIHTNRLSHGWMAQRAKSEGVTEAILLLRSPDLFRRASIALKASVAAIYYEMLMFTFRRKSHYRWLYLIRSNMVKALAVRTLRRLQLNPRSQI